MRFHFVAVLALAAALPALADEPKVFSVDLTKDGKLEKIETRRFSSEEGGQFEYYQLVVTDSDGKSVWESPRTTDPADKLAFGSFEGGTSLPEVVGDIDGDGAIELVAPKPQSEVAPTEFRVLRWIDKQFKPVSENQLVESKPDSGVYPWGKTDKGTGRWVSRFLTATGGEITAEIIDFQGDINVKSGTATLVPDKAGYKLKAWLTPLAISNPQPASAAPESAAPGSASPAAAEPRSPGGEKPLAEYMCQIGKEDIKSSAGKALTTLAEVLRQDRANFHKFKIRHRRDIDEETYFKEAANRDLFTKVPVNCPPDLAAKALGGDVTLQIRAYKNRIDVTLPD